jgi:hypothetical protein
MLSRVLTYHGCRFVSAAGDWHKWSAGSLVKPEYFIFIGPSGGFRAGKSRTNSADRPVLKARLLAEFINPPPPAML